MKKIIKGENWFFVDESGDPVFYDRNGNLIVGQEGCSPILILGFIETTNPQAIRQTMQSLHQEIASDPYLQDIPSMVKTNRAFHAKDDCPEVRYLVFKRIAELDFKAQFIVARKIEKIFRNTFRRNEYLFYDYLVNRLFVNVLHRHSRIHIYFAKRGSGARQAPLEAAIRRGANYFEEKWKTTVTSDISIFSQSPVGEPCLQVIDYMNWAVYRAFTKREMRYYRVVEDKVSLLVDWYDKAKRPNNWYNRRNPFDIEKTSPL